MLFSILFFAALLGVHFVSPHSIDLKTIGIALGAPPAVGLTPEEFKKGLLEIRDSIKEESKAAQERLDAIEEEFEKLKGENTKLRKQIITARSATVSRPGQVSEGCALWLAATFIKCAEVQGKLDSGENYKRKDFYIGEANRILKEVGQLEMQQRAALTLADTPLPTLYGKEIAELVYQYGDARKYTTIYPLGGNIVQLPRLKTSPAFGFIDMSGAVTEKSPQFEWVQFQPLKAGGIVRIPSEIDSDSMIALGQWIAKYIAREWAKWEDEVLWNADASATYKTRVGVLLKADQLSKKITLTTGNTSTDDTTLANLRLLRGQVDAGALTTATYYLHPTMDGLLSTFNSGGTNPYTIMDGKPKLDGYPVRWIGVMKPYSSTSTPNAYSAAFGAMEYWGFGERGAPEIAISKDVFFATDEIGIRALERFDIGLMADAAVAVIKLAAS